MAYEWLIGNVPFHAENWMALGMKKVQQPPPRLPSAPAVVEQVVLRALATDPKDRFPSICAFAEALAAAQPATGKAAPDERQSRLTVRWCLLPQHSVT